MAQVHRSPPDHVVLLLLTYHVDCKKSVPAGLANPAPTGYRPAANPQPGRLPRSATYAATPTRPACAPAASAFRERSQRRTPCTPASGVDRARVQH